MSGSKQNPNRWALLALVVVVIGLVAGLVAWLGPQGGTAPAQPPASAAQAPSDAVCARAGELVAAGDPGRALELIRSSATLQGDSKEQICPGEFAQALIATSAPAQTQPVPVWFVGLLGDRATVPEVLVIALGLVLALATLARVVIPWISGWPRFRPGISQPLMLVGFVLLGAGAAVVAITVTGTGGPGTWSVFWAGAVLAVVGSSAVALGLATRLRLTIRCTGPDGAESATLVGRVVARLGELGSEPAAGIEVPRGTDVDVLGGSSLGSLPEGRVAKLLVGIATAILATNPWQVLVDAQADGAYAVSVTRNGRAVRAATVSRDLVRLPDDDAGKKARDQADLVTLVAAFVLATLAGAYRGFDALGGATDWVGIGQHAVATTDRRLANAHATELLAHAVDHDPGNWPAQVALRLFLWRDSTDEAELAQYLTWLDSTIRSLGDRYPSLTLRMRTTRALARVNHHCTHAGAGTLPAQLRGDVKDLVDALVRNVGSYPHLVRETEGTAWSLVLLLEPREAARALAAAPVDEPLAQIAQRVLAGPTPHHAAAPDVPLKLAGVDANVLRAAYREPLSARASYSTGCAFATLSGAKRALAELAVPHLRVALALQDVQEWMGKDPQLADFRETDEYRKAFLEPPRTDFFELEQVSGHASQLKAAGFATVDRLRGLAAEPLVRALPGIDGPTAAAIGELAELRASMTSPLLQRYGIEVLAALARRDRGSRRALAQLRHDGTARSRLAREVRDDVLKRCRPVDQDGTPTASREVSAALEGAIARWLWSVADEGARGTGRSDGQHLLRWRQHHPATFTV